MGKIENGIYYGSNGKPAHRGIVKIDDKLYYAGEKGVLVRNCRKTIHHGMAHGMVHHGSYYFDEDGVCDKSSYKEVQHSESDARRAKSFNFAAILAGIAVGLVIACVVIAVLKGF